MKSALFNPRPNPRLLRQAIPRAENVTSVAIAGLLMGLIVWISEQRDRFDPASRDVSIAELQNTARTTKLYTPPLTLWRDPNSARGSEESFNLGLYPPAISDNNWHVKSSVKRFDATTLYEKINGEAPKFLRQGFQQMDYLVLVHRQSGAEMAIELYDQATMAGAMGLFANHLSDDQHVEKSGSVRFFRTAIGLIGHKGQFFFRAAADRDGSFIRDKSSQLAAAFDALPAPTSNQSPAAVELLQQALGVETEHISFQSENVFQYDFAQNFWFAKLVTDQPAQAFLHSAESKVNAKRLFSALSEALADEFELREQLTERALFWQPYLKRFFLLRQYHSNLIGVENASDAQQAEQSIEQIAQLLGPNRVETPSESE